MRWSAAGAALLFLWPAAGRSYEMRINCGGPAYTTVDGKLYLADRAYASGSGGYTTYGFIGDTWQPVGGTPDQPLYETLRGNCAYRFDVPSDWYLITFHIVDFWSHGPRQNQYDVLLEGSTVIPNLDVFDRVGKNYALVYREARQITDGSVDIGLHVDERHAYISAISVESRAPDATPPAAPAGAVAYGSYLRNSISWEENTEDDLGEYEVYRAPAPAGPWSLLGTVQVGWYHDRTALVGTPYYYRVRAVDAYGNASGYSDVVNATARPTSASELPFYEILMDLDDLDQLNSDEGTSGDVYFPATFVHGTEVFQGIGARYRGNVIRTLSKKSWKLEFNESELFQGEEHLNLNSEFSDRTLLREFLAFEAFDATSLPRSRNAFVNVALNGDYLGVHNSVQQVDKHFLDENDLDTDGSLYKCYSNMVVLGSLEEYMENYQKETNEELGYGDLIDLIELLGGTTSATFYSTMAPIFDLEGALNWFSVNILLSNPDWTYKNYYLHHDLDDDRWSVIPWDMDFTFGKLEILDNLFVTNRSLTFGYSSHRLTQRMLQLSVFRRKHAENLIALARGSFSPEAMNPRIDELHEWVRDDAVMDFLKQGWEDTGDFLAGPDGLKGYVAGRAAYIEANAAGILTGDDPVVNELMARNATTITDEFGEFEDWIEIYNGSTAAKELTGMFLTDDPLATTKWEIPELVLAPGGHALFWADEDTLQGPMHTNFKLDGDGEWVGLFASLANSNIPIDFKRFGPQQNDVSLGRSPDGGLYWTPYGNPSPGGAPGGPPNAPPAISGTAHSPQYPAADDTVAVTARIHDDDGISIAWVLYEADGSPGIAQMYDDGAHGDAAPGDSLYGARIAPRPDGTEVLYYVQAIDGASIAATDPFGAPDDRYVYEVGYTVPALRVNELLADNGSINQDEAGDFDDWVEIYNAGDHAIDLGGMHLTDSLEDSTKWVFPDTTLAPGGHLIVWCDEEGGEGPLHANFKLGADGEEIGLFERAGFGGVRIDAVVFYAQQVDISFGRYPDGADAFQLFGAPTPGGPNVQGNSPPGILDPWMSPNPPPAGAPVTLTAEIVDDSGISSASVLYDPVDDGIPNWILAILRDDGAHGDGLPGDRVYGATLPGQPSGSLVKFYFSATDDSSAVSVRPPGGANDPYEYVSGYTPPAIRLNEIMALNVATLGDELGEFDDWIEIYNAGATPVALGGMYLDDDVNGPPVWTLPDTTLGSGEFLLVWADNDPEQGPLHASFALSGFGEAVALYDTIDHFYAIIDSVTFGPQKPDTSYGRYPDGDGIWVFMREPTPGEANSFVSAPDFAPPLVFSLGPSTPNPFGASTVFRYVLDRTGPARLLVFDVGGRRVRTLLDGFEAPGRYAVAWNGRDDGGRALAPGVYFIRLQSVSGTATRKLVRVR